MHRTLALTYMCATIYTLILTLNFFIHYQVLIVCLLSRTECTLPFSVHATFATGLQVA